MVLSLPSGYKSRSFPQDGLRVLAEALVPRSLLFFSEAPFLGSSLRGCHRVLLSPIEHCSVLFMRSPEHSGAQTACPASAQWYWLAWALGQGWSPQPGHLCCWSLADTDRDEGLFFKIGVCFDLISLPLILGANLFSCGNSFKKILIPKQHACWTHRLLLAPGHAPSVHVVWSDTSQPQSFWEPAASSQRCGLGHSREDGRWVGPRALSGGNWLKPGSGCFRK